SYNILICLFINYKLVLFSPHYYLYYSSLGQKFILDILNFTLEIHCNQPDQIPFVESGDYVAYDNEKGGVIQKLKEDGAMYELWLGSDGKSTHKIYYSDLPWPIGKILYHKQVRVVKQLLRITSENAERRDEEIHSRAVQAYGALSSLLGEQLPTFGCSSSWACSETSVLRSKRWGHANLVRYAEIFKTEYFDASSSSSSVPQTDASSKPKSKPKREKMEEEKKFRRAAKYFLATQLVAVSNFPLYLVGPTMLTWSLGTMMMELTPGYGSVGWELKRALSRG
ncbi:metaxin-related family protein, partial [Striga asiatica]